MSRKDLFPKTKKGQLAHIEEECGEVIKQFGKLHRFGMIAIDPKTNIQYDNFAILAIEIQDLYEAIQRYYEN